MKYRIMLTTAIYNRLIAKSYAEIQKVSCGTILTLITSDLFKSDLIFNLTIFLFIGPLGVMLVVGLTYIEIGWSAFLIIPLFPSQLIIQFILGYSVSVVYDRGLRYSDVMNKHIREFIEGICLTKCFAWEYAVESIIKRV